MKYFSLISLIICLLFCSISAEEISSGTIILNEYEQEETRELVKLVCEAADLVEELGEAAFPEFRVENSKWYFDDIYVFVWSMDGMRYVYPRDISGEGHNMADLQDINGKPIGKMFIETASRGQGWVFYEWTVPGQEEPQWKSTFIKRATTPSGKEYLVGIGLYNMPVEKKFIEDMVFAAADLIKEVGLTEAQKRFRTKEDKYIFQNIYIFLNDIDGNELFNPVTSKTDNKFTQEQYEKVTNYYQNEIRSQLLNKRKVWMSYEWPDPKDNRFSRKDTFLHAIYVDEDQIVVGAGYYPE